MTSGGTGSWFTGMLVHARLKWNDSMTLLYADTREEDIDLYRFLEESSHLMPRAKQVLLDQGEDIWDVFARKRYIGNTRIDPCSYYLKRVPMREWLEAHCGFRNTVCYLGIDWTESHRFEKAQKYWAPWRVEAPLCDPPYYTKDNINAELARYGIALPALTREGFPHNNCGGGCVKGGQGHFKMLLEKRPETYARWEQKERDLREVLGDVAILRDRRGGKTKPLPLTVLRRRIETGDNTIDVDDIGGCACAVGDFEQDQALRVALG
jgi:hypothetical protein